MQLKASAPASLMMLGEYAVLHHEYALVVAVDQRIEVILTPRDDDKVTIDSTLGQYQTTINDLAVEKPFQFVLTAIKLYEDRYTNGFDLKITSSFSHQVGLGSSAAVTVATLAVLVTWLRIKMTPLELLRQGRHVIREVQGSGSGADVAASVYGGMVAYRAQPLSAEKLPCTYPISLLYSGYKTPTPEVIKLVRQRYREHTALFQSLINSIGKCAEEGIRYARDKAWKKLGDVMNVQQGLMESLGVSGPLFHDLVTSLRQQPTILGAKISGSGLGDCVLGLGEIENTMTFSSPDIKPVMVNMSPQGVQCEKI